MNATIFDLFARSPIKPIEQHMDKAYLCVEALVPFFEAALKGDWDAAKQQYELIDKLEREADELKKDIRLHMPKGLFMSVPRTDLLDLVSAQDKVANKAEDISGLMLGRKMTFPKEMEKTLLAFLSRSIEACMQARKAINELDELAETGFRGREAALVEEMITELDRIEHDSDNLEVDCRVALFALESGLPPVDVMFMYKILEWIGDLADHAEKVGNSLELLLAR